MSPARRRLVVGLGALAVVLIVVVGVGFLSAPPVQPAGRQISTIDEAVALGVLDQQVVDEVRSAGRSVAFVALNAEPLFARVRKEFPNPADRAALLDRLDALIAGAKQALTGTLGDRAVLLQDYQLVATLELEFRSEAALLAAAKLPVVTSIHAPRTGIAHVKESKLVVRQPEAIVGHDGTGSVVAVLDTGVDWQKYAGTWFEDGDVVDSYEAADADKSALAYGHGTHVASTVLAMAPGAKVVNVDIFVLDTKIADEPQWSDGRIIDGVRHVLALKRAWLADHSQCCNVVAINLSVGTSETYETAACDDAFGFGSAWAAGIIPVVSAGNDAEETGPFKEGISYPACDPYALSVGATSDAAISGSLDCDDAAAADEIVYFSQTGPNLKLLAPGLCIVAAGGAMQGTSMAAPHVSGAVAVLASARADATADDIWKALTTTGRPLIDTRPTIAITRNRLDMKAAVDALLGAVSGPAPATPAPVPVGGVSDILFGVDRFDPVPLSAGESANLDIFGVRNPNADATTFEMFAEPLEGSSAAVAPASWFTFDPSSVTIAVASSTLVSTRLSIPAGTAPGVYEARVGARASGGILGGLLHGTGSRSIRITVGAGGTGGDGGAGGDGTGGSGDASGSGGDFSALLDDPLTWVLGAVVILVIVGLLRRPARRPPGPPPPAPRPG